MGPVGDFLENLFSFIVVPFQKMTLIVFFSTIQSLRLTQTFYFVYFVWAKQFSTWKHRNLHTYLKAIHLDRSTNISWLEFPHIPGAN